MTFQAVAGRIPVVPAAARGEFAASLTLSTNHKEKSMKITLKEWLARHGYASLAEALADYKEVDDTYPAICSEECEVEPDGHCEHGAPSLLLAAGLI